MLLELERLYNHVADIGALCNDVGYSILNSHASRIREQLLRINPENTLTRLLPDYVEVATSRSACGGTGTGFLRRLRIKARRRRLTTRRSILDQKATK